MVPFIFVKELIVDESVHVVIATKRVKLPTKNMPIIHVGGTQHQAKCFDSCV